MTHVREGILAAIKTQLERIGTGVATTGKSWAQSLNPTVYRSRRTAMSEPNRPAIYIQVEGEDKERDGTGGDTTKYACQISIELVIVIEAQPEDIDTEFSKWIHDIELVLGDDHTLLGTAINSEIVGNTIRELEEGQPLFDSSVFMTADYRYFENDPSVAI